MEGVTTLVNEQIGDITGFVTGTAAPAIFGLVLLGIGIALGIKYLRKGAKGV